MRAAWTGTRGWTPRHRLRAATDHGEGAAVHAARIRGRSTSPPGAASKVRAGSVPAGADRALPARELLGAIDELRLHLLAADHDHEVAAPDALEGEACELVEVLHGQLDPGLLHAGHELLEAGLRAGGDRLLARQLGGAVALGGPDTRAQQPARRIEDRGAELRACGQQLRREALGQDRDRGLARGVDALPG